MSVVLIITERELHNKTSDTDGSEVERHQVCACSERQKGAGSSAGPVLLTGCL